MILAWLGFIILLVLGAGALIFAAICLLFAGYGVEFAGKAYLFIPLVEALFGAGLLWLAFANAPFTLVLG